jgi:hypothetical protein
VSVRKRSVRKELIGAERGWKLICEAVEGHGDELEAYYKYIYSQSDQQG